MDNKSSAVCVTQICVSIPTRRTSQGIWGPEVGGFDCVVSADVTAGTSMEKAVLSTDVTLGESESVVADEDEGRREVSSETVGPSFAADWVVT